MARWARGVWPWAHPPSTMGSFSPRAAARSGMPPRSSSVSTFVYVISNCSEMPTTSKSDRAVARSRA